MKRKTFGKPLIEHPVIRWKIAEMARQARRPLVLLSCLLHERVNAPQSGCMTMEATLINRRWRRRTRSWRPSRTR